MRDNEKLQHPSRPLAPAIVLESIIMKDQKNKTEVRYRATFSIALQHLTPAVVKYKNLNKV
jgi:hypothetical protein